VLSLVELDQGRNVLQKLWGQLLSMKNARRHGIPNRRLEVIRRVLLPDLPRCALMELMNQVVEVGGCDFAVLPPVELRPEIEESLSQLSIVSDGRPFSNQTFQCFRSVPHRELGSRLPNVPNEPRAAATFWHGRSGATAPFGC
jgi:hypothetical protein